jgi:hypothetical protein
MIFEVKFVPIVSSSRSTKIFLGLLRVASAPSMGLDVSKVGDTYLSILYYVEKQYCSMNIIIRVESLPIAVYEMLVAGLLGYVWNTHRGS